MTATSRTLAWTPIAHRYHVIEPLGSGTYGDVYLAADAELDRQVAVKVLRQEFACDEASMVRFLREAKYAARIPPHPNIVTVFDLVRDGDMLCIVLEYVRGSNLRTVIRERAPLPLLESVSVMDGILAGLGAAHRREIVHRDVKPANVLLDEGGTVKITDFGIAQALVDRDVGSDDVPGTAAYMAPEQIRNDVVGVQADLYAAGIILFELLTGRRLFIADTSLEVAAKHLKQRVPDPSTLNPAIPRALCAVVLGALEKDWRNRFADADQMSAALHAAVASLPQAPGGPRTPASPSTGPTGGRPGASWHGSSVGTESVPAPMAGAVSHVRVAEAPGAVGRQRYEPVLRALGACLDAEANNGITLMEVTDGFLVRSQRPGNATTAITVQHVSFAALAEMDRLLRVERPQKRRVRHPGLWASLPQGHQDFFRALGHELDSVGARALIVDEGDNSLTLTYQRRRGEGSVYERFITTLQKQQIERIVNAAFERRRDPADRLGLEFVDPSSVPEKGQGIDEPA